MSNEIKRGDAAFVGLIAEWFASDPPTAKRMLLKELEKRPVAADAVGGEAVAWAISYDGKTPHVLWTDGDGALLDAEVKRLGGTTCKIALYTHPAPEPPMNDTIKALRLFIGAATPVAPEINPRGHNWSEAYLDQALEAARAALAAAEAQGEPVACTREQHFALREAHAIGASDRYFAANPTHDNDAGRMLFERGFARGFDKGAEPLYLAHPPAQAAVPEGWKLLEDGKTMIPNDWTWCRMEWEPGYPEDVAFGPVRMMERLKKWLDRYFAMPYAPQAAAPAGWQPIETAPKDGTSVLLCTAIDADGEPIDWSDDWHTAQVFVQVAAWWDGDDAWIVYCSQIAEPRLHFEPTHWMPLPASPAGKESGNG